jgi:hypothetical protein
VGACLPQRDRPREERLDCHARATRCQATLFYAFVIGAPVTVLAQEDRHATTTQLVNNGVVPYGCNPGRIGPGPTPMVPYTP